MSSPEAWQQEKEFLDYMFVSLHHPGGTTAGAGAATTTPVTVAAEGAVSRTGSGRRSSSGLSSNKSPVLKDAPAGLDHLDHLCRLMEQLGELRDANSRLQKRVQYLEDMKTLQEMHQELDIFVQDEPPSSVQTGQQQQQQQQAADRSLDSLLDSSGEILLHQSTTAQSQVLPDKSESRKKRKHNHQQHHHHRFKKPATLLLKQRERSKSVGFDESLMEDAAVDEQQQQQQQQPQPAQKQQSRSIKTKVSKWTRVKEAFRWEKAHVSKQPQVMLKEEPVSARVAVHLAGIDSPAHHHAVVIKSASPVFRLGRRRRSNGSVGTRTPNSSSSSSLSECPLESEILKSFADAQELPILRMENDSGELKRLNRQSTISCDANFAATGQQQQQEAGRMMGGSGGVDPSAVVGIQANVKSNAKEHQQIQRKTSSKPLAVAAGLAETGSDQQVTTPGVVETDESGSFISNLRSQLKPINEWTAKWHHDLMKINNTTPPPTTQSTGEVPCSSKNSLSVPSTPNQHQAFTFDVYPEAGLEHGTASRENSPGSLKTTPLNVMDGSNSPSDHEPKSPSGRFSSQSNARPAAGQLLNSISPEFRKKVEVWERLKSGLTPLPNVQDQQPISVTPPTPHSVGYSGGKHSKSMESPDWNDLSKRRSESDKLPPAFKKKLAEWEIRKAVAGKSDREVEELQKILPQDFNRKLQEWERMKQAAAAGKSVTTTSSPGLERQGSAGKRHQQQQHNRGNTATNKPSSKAVSHKIEAPEAQHCEKQKEKELQWLEKELQKIEREKLRLEREREKYIERESRLEKIREAMRQPGHGPQREICIRTSTGEFRFQGLSRKFTKKLFQWEEQKGIRPEASTIALLDGAYHPQGIGQQHVPSSLVQSCQSDGGGGGSGGSPNVTRPTSLALGRSKSESSVADLVNTSVHSQPSSLSLNEAATNLEDVDELGAQALPAGPGALLVEVEDVVEESAAMVDILEVEPQSAVYSIAPSEMRQTAQFSEQLEGEPRMRHHATVERNDSVRTEASFKLLEENISLIDRLRAKGEIVKYLELQMNSIDGDMAGVASTQTEELVRLKKVEEHSGGAEVSVTSNNSSTIDRLRHRIVLLETRGQQLKSEKEQLQMVYHRQCNQQVQLVQHLVDKMQQLRGTAIDPHPPLDPEALQRLDTLTSELLHEAQALETSIRQPQQKVERVPSLKSAVVAIPEQLSAKAHQLKEEFERLRSFDSDLEDAESDDDTAGAVEVVLTPKLLIPAPIQSSMEQLEMSSAAAKKIFVETRRLVFAPVDHPPAIVPVQVMQLPTASPEPPEEEIPPWRRISRTSTKDGSNSDCSTSCRKTSGSTTTLDGNPTATVRTTAPNIRRMIDMYHQRVTGVRERPNLTLNLRLTKCDSPVSGITTRSPSSSPSPPPGIVVKAPTPQPGEGSAVSSSFTDRQTNHFNFLQPMIGISKSQSTGTMEVMEPHRKVSQQQQTQLSHQHHGGISGVLSGVLRSRSGHQMPSSSSGNAMQTIGIPSCARNPSFFRKSPLDPSIDDLLQKYRGRGGRRSIQPLPPELPRSPATANPERAIKLKQAREAFLTIGPGAIANSPEEQQSPQASPSEHSERGEKSTKPEKSQLTVLSGSCPPSPTPHRAPTVAAASRNATNQGRRSWLKQPAAFFFSRTPKTP